MNLAFDAKRLFSNFTGLGNYSRTLVRDLAHFYPENEYHLFTPKFVQHPDCQYFLNNENFKIHQPSGSFGAIWRTFGIPAEARKNGIEIYHGLSHEIPVGMRREGIRTVVTIHDLIFKVYPKLFPWFDRRMYDWKFRYACENADVVVAISESTKRDIVRFYGIAESKIHVVYQTCHERFLEQKSEVEKLETAAKYGLPKDFLLYVGAVNERKNLLHIVKAMELLPPSFDLPLLVVGDGGAYLRTVKDYLAGKPIGNRVIFQPKLDVRDLPALYQQARILIYPSIYEGFGIPIIEALCSGTPVITSPVSSLPEAGGEHSYYADPASPESIAAGIERILTDDAFRQTMIKEGLNYVQKFDRQRVTSEMMGIYRTLNVGR